MTRPSRRALGCSAVLALGALLAACGDEPAAENDPGPSNSATRKAAPDCLDVAAGPVTVGVRLEHGLHPVTGEPESYSAGDDITVKRLQLLARGGAELTDADASLAVFGTSSDPGFGDDEALQRTISENGGPMLDLSDLELRDATAADRPARHAHYSNVNGDYDAWTWTDGDTRFVVVADQEPTSEDEVDLGEATPDLLVAGGCDNA